MTALEFVKNLSNGWNLGNTLDAIPEEHNPEVESPSPELHETSWFNPITTEDMIKLVASSGFGILRLPTSWRKQIGPGPDFIIKKPWMDRIQEVVDYGINNGLTVILNLHHEDWLFTSYENYPVAAEKLKAVWSQIAKRFADYDNRLIFEAMNEPRKNGTPVEWNGGDEEGREVVMKWNKVFMETVRSSGGNNPTRMLMVPNYAASIADVAMGDFEVPDSADKNTIVSIHCYEPFNFAIHEDKTRVTFDPNNKEETRELDEALERVDKYFVSRGIPVIIGECAARNKNNLEARVAWSTYFSKKLRDLGIPGVWWDNGIFEGKGELFGLMDRKGLRWKDPEVVDAFLGK